MKSFEEMNLVFGLSIDMEATGKRICDLLASSGLSREEVMDSLGLSTQQTFWKWAHGRSIPSTDNLMRLSVLLDVPMDDLLIVGGREQARSALHPDRSPEQGNIPHPEHAPEPDNGLLTVAREGSGPSGRPADFLQTGREPQNFNQGVSQKESGRDTGDHSDVLPDSFTVSDFYNEVAIQDCCGGSAAA